MKIKMFSTLALAAALLVFRPVNAWCYEKDVHFSLTYVLARASGFEDREALIVASADVGMDLNASTAAWPVTSFDFRRKNRLWHSFGKNRHEVLRRRDDLWQRAITTRDLINLGQFLHFEQDLYSHRRKLGPDWEPYGDAIGHVLQGNTPDRIPYNVPLAQEMAQETASYLLRFSTEVLGRHSTGEPVEKSDAMVGRLAAAYTRITARPGNSKRPVTGTEPQWGRSDPDKVIIALGSPPLSQIVPLKFSSSGYIVPSYTYKTLLRLDTVTGLAGIDSVRSIQWAGSDVTVTALIGDRNQVWSSGKWMPDVNSIGEVSQEPLKPLSAGLELANSGYRMLENAGGAASRVWSIGNSLINGEKIVAVEASPATDGSGAYSGIPEIEGLGEVIHIERRPQLISANANGQVVFAAQFGIAGLSPVKNVWLIVVATPDR